MHSSSGYRKTLDHRATKNSRDGKANNRMRLGDYRVIYSIEEMALVVRIIKVGHRRDIYEKP